MTPGGAAPFYSSTQAAIYAATGSPAGERTAADPAVVLVLSGSNTESVILKKHIIVSGLDRLGDYETILRGGITCDLTIEGGGRELTLAVWRGVAIFNSAGTVACAAALDRPAPDVSGPPSGRASSPGAP